MKMPNSKTPYKQLPHADRMILRQARRIRDRNDVLRNGPPFRDRPLPGPRTHKAAGVFLPGVPMKRSGVWRY